MGLPPLSKIPLILRPQAWLHRRHYGEVQTLTARSGSTIACQRAQCANVPV